jgi:hypothetical protein
MKRLLVPLAFIALNVGLFQGAPAQTSATQDVTISVPKITALAMNGGSISFNFTSSDATAGSGTASLNKSDSYALFTNVTGNGVKITGTLSSGFASGITLKANLASPAAGGSSEGPTALSTTATDLVTGISPTAESGLALDYTAEITPQAAPNSGTTETVTYTIIAQ